MKRAAGKARQAGPRALGSRTGWNKLWIVLGVAVFFGTSLLAQQAQSTQPEIRADAIISRWTAAQVAAGLSFPVGVYVRSGVNLGAGGGGRGFDSRVDIFSRFNLDPFRQSRWAPYGGGGLSGRYSERDSTRAHAYLLMFIGIEGPLAKANETGWVPALELGLGGGARLGVVLRRGIPGRR